MTVRSSTSTPSPRPRFATGLRSRSRGPAHSRRRWRSSPYRCRPSSCRRRRRWPSPPSSRAAPWRIVSWLPGDRRRYRPPGRRHVRAPRRYRASALRRAASPITTLPRMASLLSSRRMASTAARSASFGAAAPEPRGGDGGRLVMRATSITGIAASQEFAVRHGAAFPGFAAVPFPRADCAVRGATS